MKIFSCLYLKFDEGLLPYSMLEVFNKTGHGLTDIIIAWDEFNPVLHPDFFWTPRYINLLCVSAEPNALYHDCNLFQKYF